MPSTSDTQVTQLRAAVAELPALSWIQAFSESAKKLSDAIAAHLGGSSHQQPDQAIREAREIAVLLERASAHIASSIGHIGQFSLRHDGGAIDAHSATWSGASAGQVPSSPDVTLTSLTTFCSACRSVLPADTLHRAAEQCMRASSRVASVGGSAREISAAVGALNLARKSFADASPRIAAMNASLAEYQAAALGATAPVQGAKTH